MTDYNGFISFQEAIAIYRVLHCFVRDLLYNASVKVSGILSSMTCMQELCDTLPAIEAQAG